MLPVQIIRSANCPFPTQYLQTTFQNAYGGLFFPLSPSELSLSQSNIPDSNMSAYRGNHVPRNRYVSDWVVGCNDQTTIQLNHGNFYTVVVGTVTHVSPDCLSISESDPSTDKPWYVVHTPTIIRELTIERAGLCSLRDGDGKSIITDLHIGSRIKVLLRVHPSVKNGIYVYTLMAYYKLPGLAELTQEWATLHNYWENMTILNNITTPTTTTTSDSGVMINDGRYLTSPEIVMPIRYDALLNVDPNNMDYTHPGTARLDGIVNLKGRVLSALCTVRDIDRTPQAVKSITLDQCMGSHQADGILLSKGINWPSTQSTVFPKTLQKNSIVLLYFYVVNETPPTTITSMKKNGDKYHSPSHHHNQPMIKLLALRHFDPQTTNLFNLIDGWQQLEGLYWEEYARLQFKINPFSSATNNTSSVVDNLTSTTTQSTFTATPATTTSTQPPTSPVSMQHDNANGEISSLTNKIEMLLTLVEKQQQRHEQIIQKHDNVLCNYQKMIDQQQQQIAQQQQQIAQLQQNYQHKE